MVHTHFVKSGFEADLFASTSLVDMYSKLGLLKTAQKCFDEMKEKDIPTWNSIIAGYTKFGDMEGANKLFNLMPFRNVISWTSMISGYSQNGQYREALSMFIKMENDKAMRPNEVTIASVLPACANIGALEVGERIEAYARINGYFSNLFVSNALLEMYSRCGKIDKAKSVFDEIGSRRNLCSWNSMIMGLAVNGRCKEALEVFNNMLREGTAPDDVTFVGVLLACAHGGFVTKGWELFQKMEQNHFLVPKLEHYGCMVDLLGRSGKLMEAYDFINTMPIKPDAIIWGVLLGACSFYGHVELAEISANRLFVLEPWNPANYVILSNIYALAGKWDAVARLRKVMKGSKITKGAGYSFVEEGGHIHKFIVEDRSHPRYIEVYALLDELSTEIIRSHDENDFCYEFEYYA